MITTRENLLRWRRDYLEGLEILDDRIAIRTACPSNLSPADRFVLGITSMPFRTVSEMQEAIGECRKYRNTADPVLA